MTAWTFADQLSSYRFWGLLAAWVCAALSMQLLRSNALKDAMDVMGRFEMVQVMGVVPPLGMLLGLVLGLLLVRGALVPGLLVLLSLAAVLWPLAAGLWMEPSLLALGVTLLVGQLLPFTLMVVVLAVLAGGRGGTLAFASVLVVVLALKSMLEMLAPGLGLYLLDGRWPNWASPGLGLLAVLCLLPLLRPAARALFNAAPPVRHQALKPCPRSPWGMALWVGLVWLAVLMQLLLLWLDMAGRWTYLSQACALAGLVGLVRWNYRLHGEVAFVAPSPELLTPRAAAWASLLVPLSSLLLPLQLAAVLNQAQRSRISMGWLLFWCLLLPPVALALVQRALNEAAATPMRTEGEY
ncbi:hypothetical protein [Comamonas sp. GB3 AK4-5]|uniref:hypothetical protein n=1 Tax=Comamonas sp. GB3 AK4-5 TaxID=3231487 RepID=UPI00351F63EA